MIRKQIIIIINIATIRHTLLIMETGCRKVALITGVNGQVSLIYIFYLFTGFIIVKLDYIYIYIYIELRHF